MELKTFRLESNHPSKEFEYLISRESSDDQKALQELRKALEGYNDSELTDVSK